MIFSEWLRCDAIVTQTDIALYMYIIMLFLVLYLTFHHEPVNLTVLYKACLSQALKMGS